MSAVEQASEASIMKQSEHCEASIAKQTLRSKRMSERCKQLSDRTSEWLRAYVPIIGCFEPLCIARERRYGVKRFCDGSAPQSENLW